MTTSAKSWTIQETLKWTTEYFTSKQISSSRLDAELLLASALKCNRIDLYLNSERPVIPSELQSFKELIVRRAKQEPVAYILGRKEFYTRDFFVGPGVLVPRPETEHLIDEVKRVFTDRNMPLNILDVGAGSGCLGITAALEFNNSKALCLDVSPESEKYVRKNISLHNCGDRVGFILKDFLEFDRPQSFDLTISNPPYIGRAEEPGLEKTVVDYEPALALFGGEKGTEVIERWLQNLIKVTVPGGWLFIEIGKGQSEFVGSLFSKQSALSKFGFCKDYSGVDRIAWANLEK